MGKVESQLQQRVLVMCKGDAIVLLEEKVELQGQTEIETPRSKFQTGFTWRM
jgi:hypothetical protein